MSPKIVILFILSLLMSFALIAAGIYFASEKFLNKLNEASAIKNAQAFAKNKVRAKGSAYISLGLGALTLVWAVMLMIFPGISSYLSLIYMAVLFISCVFLVFLYK